MSKNGKSVTLGFGTVDEAKFFRRQINRFVYADPLEHEIDVLVGLLISSLIFFLLL